MERKGGIYEVFPPFFFPGLSLDKPEFQHVTKNAIAKP